MEIKKGRPSSTAEEVAIHRAVESMRPENERICHDPYAIRFLSPETSRFLEMIANGSSMAKAKMEEMNRLFPGTQNSIVARVRYIDDIVEESIDDGIEQLVILGAGYDTRAHRIKRLEKIKVFEVDHPSTQAVKIEKVKEIFGSLPAHVRYVPVDIGSEDLCQRFTENGYDRSQRTLFTMEGLLYYFPPKLVDELLSFIAVSSGRGSTIVFDYFPKSMVDGTCKSEVGKRIRERVERYGEPLKFGIREGAVVDFLTQRGFFDVKDVTSEDYKKAYFRGANANRDVCSLYSFAHARVN